MQEHPQGFGKDDLVFENSALNFIHLNAFRAANTAEGTAAAKHQSPAGTAPAACAVTQWPRAAGEATHEACQMDISEAARSPVQRRRSSRLVPNTSGPLM